MSKKKTANRKSKAKVPAKKKTNKKTILGVVAAFFIAITLYSVVFNNTGSDGGKSSNHIVGPVDLCRSIPPIAKARGLSEPMMIDLRQIGYDGLRIIEGKENGKILQLNEWDDAGHLGPYTLDKAGNIFTSPVPHVSLEINKPEDQNRILRVDGQTGEMKEYIRFPRPANTSHNNPFGVMGLAYDCKTESIYACSIAGSGPNNTLGVIYQVDLKTKEIISQLDNVDAIGIGVFVTKTGKRLYYGSARDPEVFSVSLDDNGQFAGQPKFEFSLAAQQGGSADRGHRIRFTKDKKMEVKGIEFSYSLMAASDPMRNIYNFKYDTVNDKWMSLGVHKQ